ncbi:MAG: hypothetical protein JXA44_13790 [Methanospirillaceae archaeon]|nr:hypothetical protein [Methanospirillaceae archaeon]
MPGLLQPACHFIPAFSDSHPLSLISRFPDQGRRGPEQRVSHLPEWRAGTDVRDSV